MKLASSLLYTSGSNPQGTGARVVNGGESPSRCYMLRWFESNLVPSIGLASWMAP